MLLTNVSLTQLVTINIRILCATKERGRKGKGNLTLKRWLTSSRINYLKFEEFEITLLASAFHK